MLAYTYAWGGIGYACMPIARDRNYGCAGLAPLLEQFDDLHCCVGPNEVEHVGQEEQVHATKEGPGSRGRGWQAAGPAGYVGSVGSGGSRGSAVGVGAINRLSSSSPDRAGV